MHMGKSWSTPAASEPTTSQNSQRDGAEILRALVRTAARAAQKHGVGIVKSDVEAELCAVMDKLRPEHLALNTPSPRDRAEPLVIRTQSIWAAPELDLVVFLFPAGSVIPLHNHPEMTVLSKVLYGSLAVRAYDWVDGPPSRAELQALSLEMARQESESAATRAEPPIAPPRAARLRASGDLTAASPTAVLRPNWSNVHSFTATTDCAVLDLLMPPYDDDAGRDCHYFVEQAAEGGGGGEAEAGAALLRPQAALDLDIRAAPYRGLSIQPRAPMRPTEEERLATSTSASDDAPQDILV